MTEEIWLLFITCYLYYLLLIICNWVAVVLGCLGKWGCPPTATNVPTKLLHVCYDSGTIPKNLSVLATVVHGEYAYSYWVHTIINTDMPCRLCRVVLFRSVVKRTTEAHISGTTKNKVKRSLFERLSNVWNLNRCCLFIIIIWVAQWCVNVC